MLRGYSQCLLLGLEPRPPTCKAYWFFSVGLLIAGHARTVVAQLETRNCSHSSCGKYPQLCRKQNGMSNSELLMGKSAFGGYYYFLLKSILISGWPAQHFHIFVLKSEPGMTRYSYVFRRFLDPRESKQTLSDEWAGALRDCDELAVSGYLACDFPAILWGFWTPVRLVHWQNLFWCSELGSL